MADVNGSIDLSRPMEIASGEKTLYGILRGFTGGVFFSDGAAGSPPLPIAKRIGESFSKQAPYIREASRTSARDLIRWTREGSPLRALLAISVGTITLLALTGLSVFMLFFLAATVNAIIVAALMSLAVAGGFLALFVACLATFYIGALSVAIFAISIITTSMITAVIVASGWIGFFCVVWLAARKSVDLAKKSLGITSSVVSAYFSSNGGPHEYEKSLKSPLVEAD